MIACGMSRRNPYHFGQAITAAERDAFVDREEALDTVVRAMLEGRNVVLAGPRRYGKTSLLHLATDMAAQRGARTGTVTLIDCVTPRDVAEALLRGILDGP